MTLTEKQRHIHDFICRFIGAYGYSPTIAEIQRQYGLKSPATVHQALSELVRKQYIRRTANAARGIEILKESEVSGLFEIPLLGIISAGKPIEAILTNDTIEVPRALKKSARTFALRVSGDSMIGEGLLDGDYVAVEPSQSARNRQIVVALINGSEATLKRFRREGGIVYLEPANSKYKTLVIRPPDTLQIQGILTGSLRLIKG
jgi:repressor LexA